MAIFQDLWNQITDKYFADPDIWIDYLLVVVKVVVIYIAAKLIIRFLNRTVVHLARGGARISGKPRRTETLSRLVSNVFKYAINFIMILMILAQFDIKLAPILAGAGVVGLAVGFGAQSLVKDIITGFFIIFEDQFAVGDTIQTKSFRGVVEEIGLRTTRIKSLTGEVHIIPNGSITEVTNYSLHNTLAIVDISVPYEADIDEAMRVIGETVAKLEEHDEVTKSPEVLGIQKLGASEVIVRVTCECKPDTQTNVAMMMNERLKKRLDAQGKLRIQGLALQKE